MSYKIPRDSWAIIERVLRRYPESKIELENRREELLESTPYNDGQPHSNYAESRVETAIVNLNSNKVLERIRKEVEAVDKVYCSLDDEKQKVIRMRYFETRWRNTPYSRLQSKVSYSERQMHRIVAMVIRKVGEELGEL